MSQLGQNESSVNGDDGANHHYYKVYNSGIQLKVGTYTLQAVHLYCVWSAKGAVATTTYAA
jgi:hypothetical protein